MSDNNEELKHKIRNFWNKTPCGTQFSDKPIFTQEYYDEIESHRYNTQPEIHSFAQFTKYHRKKVLEVGVGIGTDFIQWVRGGAIAYGIDLAPQAIEHVKNRLKIYGLQAKELKIADAEYLPYENNFFDLVYSFGVIHHTPNTEKALSEIVRVCKPAGTCKIMIYNKHSLVAFYLWFVNALLKGKPHKSFAWALYNHLESVGTKGFSINEVRTMLSKLPVENITIIPLLVSWHKFKKYDRFMQLGYKVLGFLLGGSPFNNRVGQELLIQFNKKSVNSN